MTRFIVRALCLLMLPGFVACSGTAPVEPAYDPEKVNRIRNEVMDESYEND